MMTDAELSKLAEQALLQEAKRGAIRAEISGPSGWLKNKLPSTNKKFLHNTLLGALAANRVQERKEKNQSENGKRKRELEEKERFSYKKMYIKASTKSNVQKAKNYIVPNPETKCKENSRNTVTWSESGLEFSNSNQVQNRNEKRVTELQGKQNFKETSICLPRKIKFISGRNKGTHNLQFDD